MLNIIVGRSGYGKTELLFKEIEKKALEGYKCIVLTPEQVSFEYERIVALKSAELGEKVEVLNFTRLSKLCFNKFGGPKGELVSETATYMLMGLALEEIKDTLQIYSRNYHSYGFITKLNDTIKQMRRDGITPNKLSNISFSLEDGYLKTKAFELSVIFDTYYAFMANGYFDENDATEIAAEKLSPHGRLNELFDIDKTAIFIDGFSGFTAPQYKLLEALFNGAETSFITLTLDPEDYDNQVFSSTAKTLSRIKKITLRNDISISLQELKTAYRFKSEGAEKAEMLSASYETKLEDNVYIYPAKSGYDEVEWIASEIMRLVREEDYRFKDIVVIPRSTSRYGSFIGNIFDRYGISHYLDERKNTVSSLLVNRLLAFSSLASKSLASSLIFDLLKSPLMNLPIEAVCELENYCYTWNITGKAWLTPFTNHPDGLVEGMTREDSTRLLSLERLRKDIVFYLSPLIHAESRMSGREFAGLTFDMLEKKPRIAVIKISATKKGRFKHVCGRAAKNLVKNSNTHFIKGITAEQAILSFADRNYNDLTERRQFLIEESSIWDQICKALDLFSDVIGDVRLSVTKLNELLELAVASFETTTPPPTIDRVLIGTADRIRPLNPKAVFVMGAVEGEYPPPATINSLFTITESEKLWKKQDELSDTLEDLNSREEQYCYQAISSASEKVYISYPTKHGKSSHIVPSKIYTSFEMSGATALKTEERNMAINEETIFHRIAHLSSENKALALSLTSCVEDDIKLNILNDFKDKKATQIEDKEIAKEFFGDNLRLSPTKVDRYYGCPFSYFANDGLKVKGRSKGVITPLASGSLMHNVLERVVSKYGGAGITSAEDKELRAEIDSIIEEQIQAIDGKNKALTERNRYLLTRLGDSVFELVKHLAEEFSQSKFEPVAFEQEVNEFTDAPPLKVELLDGTEIKVVGKIDRVDIAVIDGKKYVRVVDYKSGNKKFALSDVYYGLNMQMLIYLFSIWKEGKGKYKDVFPAGVLYMPVISKYHTTERHSENIKAKKLEHYKMNGLLLEDSEVLEAMDASGGIFIPGTRSKNSFAKLSELGVLAQKVTDQLSNMAYSLMDGKIEAVPTVGGGFNQCQYCDYKNVCGFEDGDRIREKREVEREELLNNKAEVSEDEH